MKKIYDQYNFKSVEDAGSTMSEEAKRFARDFKRRLVANTKARGIKVVGYTVGHYFISGFLFSENTEKFVYFSYDIPRYEAPFDFNRKDCYEGFLVRSAKHARDFTGGHNNFTNLMGLMDKVEELMK